MGNELRCAKWSAPDNDLGFQHRVALRSEGFTKESFAGRPVIGICNSWSELNNCNVHLRAVADAVKRGVWVAGGFPLEFMTISLGEELTMSTTMLYRNLMAMDVEEMIRANQLDGVVLLCGCDKTTPAQLMGAASMDLPSIMLPDLWKFWDDRRAGPLNERDWHELEGCYSRSPGTCNTMGTASTMTSLAEAMGMMLPGAASIPAPDSRRLACAEATGRRIVGLVKENLRPSRILTREAFENAIRVLFALE
jgi:L-arabonate dehydrase